MITRAIEFYRVRIFVVLCLLVIGTYLRQAQSAEIINHPQNTLNGTCEEFSTHRIQNGPADSQGAYHPGWSGYTSYTIKHKSEWKVDLSKPELVSNGYRICAKLVDFKVNFSASIIKDVLRWSPKAQVSLACSQEIKDWNKAVLDHEDVHEKIIHQYIEEKNRMWNSADFQLEACGEGKDKSEAKNKAKAALEKTISSRLRMEEVQLNEKMNKEHKKHDDTNPVRPINCSICKTDRCPTCASPGFWFMPGL